MDSQQRLFWDTGSQILLLPLSWIHQNLPKISICPIQELLNETPLDVRTANVTQIPFTGWIEAKFSLSGNGGDLPMTLQVPMLVISDLIAEPVIRCNVIDKITKDHEGEIKGFHAKDSPG